MGTEFVQLSLTPIVIGILASVACALPGNFLLLRRQALIGDAISHVVLPGIVLAFLLTGTISAWPMMLGAACASVLAVLLIELTRRVGKIEPGAAMGVIFTTMFAAGVLVLEQSDTSGVHIDVEHALHGNLESLIWFSAEGWHSLLDLKALSEMPPQLWRLAIVLILVSLFLFICWRPLTISTFDPSFAEAVGIRNGLVSFALVVVVAIAAVSAFDAVGSIIVIAMFICPPAAARLMTNRLPRQIGWSIFFAVISAILGYLVAGYGPMLLGADHAVSAAGMVATVSGLILGITCLFGPQRKRIGEGKAIAQ
ncbi:MAG: metal ABC transporter permease [Methyloligellaceae bacterium]